MNSNDYNVAHFCEAIEHGNVDLIKQYVCKVDCVEQPLLAAIKHKNTPLVRYLVACKPANLKEAMQLATSEQFEDMNVFNTDYNSYHWDMHTNAQYRYQKYSNRDLLDIVHKGTLPREVIETIDWSPSELASLCLVDLLSNGKHTFNVHYENMDKLQLFQLLLPYKNHKLIIFDDALRSAPLAAQKEKNRLYKVLGVKKHASLKHIKKAYKSLALQHHPDRGGDEELFKDIAKAYSVLSNDTTRKQYDEFGEEYVDKMHQSTGLDNSVNIFDTKLGTKSGTNINTPRQSTKYNKTVKDTVYFKNILKSLYSDLYPYLGKEYFDDLLDDRLKRLRNELYSETWDTNYELTDEDYLLLDKPECIKSTQNLFLKAVQLEKPKCALHYFNHCSASDRDAWLALILASDVLLDEYVNTMYNGLLRNLNKVGTAKLELYQALRTLICKKKYSVIRKVVDSMPDAEISTDAFHDLIQYSIDDCMAYNLLMHCRHKEYCPPLL